MAFGNIMQGVRPQMSGGGGGGSFWDRMMARQGGGGAAGAARGAAPMGPGGLPARPPGGAMGGIMGAAGGIAQPRPAQPANPMATAAGMFGGARPAPQANPMASAAGMFGGGGAPAKSPLPGAAPNRPAMANIGSQLGGMAMMSDEASKKNAYLSGLKDRFAAISPEEEEEKKRKEAGLSMFQSGMGMLGR